MSTEKKRVSGCLIKPNRPVVCSPSKSVRLPQKYVPSHLRRKMLAETKITSSPVEPNNRSTKPILKAKLIGYYSVDGDRHFINDASRLMYYNPPDNMKVWKNIDRGVHLDLDEGREKAVCRNIDFYKENLDLLWEWIKLNQRKIKGNSESNRWIRPKFVSSHGTLIKLLCSREWPEATWIICAARWKGTIYLCTDKKLKKHELEDERQQRFGSWGHKFEQYILSKTPDKLPDTSEPVIETEEFRCVYQRNIGGHSVMYCAVMKGLLSKTPLKEPLPFDKLNFIELKTNRIVAHAGHDKTFRKHKMVKWWAHCYLTNIEQVLCGFRDEAGVVNKLSLYSLDEIREKGLPYWKAGNCVNFCKSLLTKIEEAVVHDCDENIYKFEKLPGGEIIISELPASSEYAFLPPSFFETAG